VQDAPLADWTTRYPVAASELDDWAHRYPDVKAKLCAWDNAHSDQVKVLTEWASAHPYEELDVFFINHHREVWGALDAMLEDPASREGLRAYVVWARRNTEAANELVAHPKGLWRSSARHVAR
jgi:hypothetical protein